MIELASKIRAILDSLTNQDDIQAKDIFREIFCNILGFSYTSEKVDLAYFRSSVSEVVESAEVIAQTEPSDGMPFFIIYVSTKRMTKTLRQMLIKDLLNFTEAIDFAFANFISIVRVGNVWQIVAPLYRKETDRIILRIYTVGYGEKHRTVAEALSKLKIEKPHPSALHIKEVVDDAMRIKPLTKEFFDDYRKYYSLIRNHVSKRYGNVFVKKCSGKLPAKIFALRAAKSFTHSLLNRLMFIYFLQKKGWLGNRKDFIRWLWDIYEEDRRPDKEFYRDYLRPLLFEAMNKPKNERSFNNLPDEVARVFLSVPYFNGGLFSHIFEENVDVDEIVTSISDEVLRAVIFEFLEEYNFTVTEESPYEVEIAVDPAMLGHIYESLIAEQERGVSGIFYTPRVEVDLMCRLAIFEYLSNFADDRMKLLEFVFKSPSEFDGRVSRTILNALERVKIVDPACGSGAFLIGAYYVIRELLEKAGIAIDFERKREIFRRNLYGVDIKEWAVRVAELRIWLALIEEEEKLSGAEPVLPNLNVNLKVGDSLIPEIEVNRKRIVLPKTFLEKWKKHIGEISYKEIADRIYDGIIGRMELEKIKTDILKNVVKELHKDAFITQKTLAGEEVGVGNFSEVEKQLIKLLYEAENIKVPFIWELDFPEVFANGGFDIVISNPPYVRQESIYPEYLDLSEFEMLNDKVRKGLKKEYKQLVISTTEDVAGSILKRTFKFNKRSDLYVYFFVHSTSLLKENGVLVYITSNSWLDVEYGTKLQEFFLRATELKYIIDNIKRTFEQADINTIITVLKRKKDEGVNVAKGNCTNFVMLKVPFENLTFNDVVEIAAHYCDTLARKVTVFGGDVYLYENERVRVRSVKDVDLCVIGGVSREETAGVEEDEVKGLKIENYAGEKWGGLFLRAPPIFYKIFARNRDKLVRLGDIAGITRGFTTGANDFFYLKKLDERPVCPVCGVVHEGDDLVPVENGAGWKGYIESNCLRYGVQKTDEFEKLVVNKDELLKYFFQPPDTDIEKFPHAWYYVQYGESEGFNKSDTCRKRAVWWLIEDTESKKPSNLGFNYNIHEIGRFFLISDVMCYFSDNYHMIYHTDPKLIAALGMSSLFALFSNVMCRSPFGGGKAKLQTYELEKIPVVHPDVITDEDKNRLKNLFDKLGSRRILFLLTEFGLPEPNDDYSNINPDDIKLKNIMPDRRELDKIIFEALGLTEEEQLEVYKAVVELVKQRLVKAQTFRSRRR